jgi:hypothetical protein
MTPTDDVMEVVQVVNKGNLMSVLETFYIYKEICTNSQLNEHSAAGHYRIFETIIQWNRSR